MNPKVIIGVTVASAVALVTVSQVIGTLAVMAATEVSYARKEWKEKKSMKEAQADGN